MRSPASTNLPRSIVRSLPLDGFRHDFDEIVKTEDNDFATSGLVKESLVRLAFLSVIPKQQAIGSIGSIERERHHRLLSNLANYLTLQIDP